MRKSLSAEVTWGVRFDPHQHHKVQHFVAQIAAYAAEQLQTLRLRGALRHGSAAPRLRDCATARPRPRSR